MDRKFNGLMKVLNEITYEHKYLEKEEAQGSIKGPEPWLSALRKKTLI